MQVAGEIITDRNLGTQAVTNNTLVNLSNTLIVMAANQAAYIRYYIPFNLAGAVSGYKFLILHPAITNMSLSYSVFSNISTLIDSKIQQGAAAAVQLAAVAIGDYFLVIEGTILTSASGNFRLQFAQSVSNAAAMTIYRGTGMIFIPG